MTVEEAIKTSRKRAETGGLPPKPRFKDAKITISERAPVPFVAGETHVPDYYRLWVRTLSRGELTQVDVMDIVRAAAEGRHPLIGFALKYLLRAGRKPGEPEINDVYKAMECLQRIVREREID